MSEFDPKLGVLVSGNEIVVVLTGSIDTVTYFKPRGSRVLLAKNIANNDDPRIPMTAAVRIWISLGLLIASTVTAYADAVAVPEIDF